MLYGNPTKRWGGDHILLGLEPNKERSRSILFWLSDQTKNGAVLFSLPNMKWSCSILEIGMEPLHSTSLSNQTHP
jgi:hypothetical protein